MQHQHYNVNITTSTSNGPYFSRPPLESSSLSPNTHCVEWWDWLHCWRCRRLLSFGDYVLTSFSANMTSTASTTTGTTNHNCIILRAGVIPDTSTSSSSYDSPIHFSDILIIYITSIISASPPPEMPERQYVESWMYAFGEECYPCEVMHGTLMLCFMESWGCWDMSHIR